MPGAQKKSGHQDPAVFRRPRLGVQRPGPGPAVAHGYPGARRCASSAVRFAWCLARSPIWGPFDVFGVNIVSLGVKTLQSRAQRPPLCVFYDASGVV